MNIRLISMVCASTFLAGTAFAGDFDEAKCVQLSEAEGIANATDSCACLAQAASQDADLSSELATLQGQAPEDRQMSEKATAAVDSCTK